jgi:UDP-glucose 4-epimerase
MRRVIVARPSGRQEVAVSHDKRILVTGATGKVGRTFIGRLMSDSAFDGWTVRALCHNRPLEATERLDVIVGSISDRATVERAMDGVTHVLHLATVKETPDLVMDVTVKGLFWLLEAARATVTLERFVLIGGDAGVGHYFVPHALPITEEHRHTAYPGCYALSKVLEEVMLEQYYVQYDLPGCCLRAPWIQEKDDFRFALSFGEDIFGGPRWRDYVGEERADAYVRSGAVPLMLDAAGVPVRRNFVHVDDLVSAILIALEHPRAHQQTFNIAMDEPVDYGELVAYLGRTRGLEAVPIQTEFVSNWLDNRKARMLLGWRPGYDLARMIDSAWDHQRPADDPRITWYPG